MPLHDFDSQLLLSVHVSSYKSQVNTLTEAYIGRLMIDISQWSHDTEV